MKDKSKKLLSVIFLILSGWWITSCEAPDIEPSKKEIKRDTIWGEIQTKPINQNPNG